MLWKYRDNGGFDASDIVALGVFIASLWVIYMQNQIDWESFDESATQLAKLLEKAVNVQDVRLSLRHVKAKMDAGEFVIGVFDIAKLRKQCNEIIRLTRD